MGRSRPTYSLLAALAMAAAALLALASPAMAADGEGLWGELDDLVITLWGFAVIAFFPILVTVLSIIQHRLETRKERAREEIERATRAE